MARIRTEEISVRLTGQLRPISMDGCWRVTVYLGSAAAGVTGTLNGIPLNLLATVYPLRYGGHPVHLLKGQLEFNITAIDAGRFLLVTREWIEE